jgi:hypothetical protein
MVIEDMPVGWVLLDPRGAELAAAELSRELPSSHVLHGVPAQAVARRLGADDYLFELDRGRVAKVHLTYTRRETVSSWPPAVIFETLGKWLEVANAV